MGMNLSNVLFTKVQQRVLALLYGRPHSSFHTNEIIRLSQSGTGAVQRELKNFANAGLVTVSKIGNQKHYQANMKMPFYSELRSIILKTFGLADSLREMLEPVAEKIYIAFIYGSIARQEDTANSDIDLLLISNDLSYADLFKLIEKAEMQLGRTVNPTFYSPMEWKRKQKEGNNFLNQVINAPKIFLIGNEDELNQF